MYDELRGRFRDSVEAIPVPAHTASAAARRGRRLVRRRLVVSAAVVAVLAGLSVAVVSGSIGGSRPSPPVDAPDDEVRNAVDMRALAVIEDLGVICDGHELYSVTEIGDALYRPAECGMRIALRMMADQIAPAVLSSPGATPPPASGPAGAVQRRLLRGPRVLVYAFSSVAAKEIWMEGHPPFWGGRIAGDTWVVDVVYPSRFTGVREELPTATVVARPTRAWRVGEHVARPLPDGYEPAARLPRVSRAVVARRPELLAAQLGQFGKTGARGVPAWILTFRQCGSEYGGSHPSSVCALDRRHLVIDAETGRTIARFST